ncbi:MAG: hypothetical protein JW969_17830 [Spirochaetales bacterium]|nr:hypothetical protein [Spirochaetales bacterium]
MKRLICMAALLIFILPLLAAQQPGPEGPLGLLKKLGVTDDQIKQIQDVNDPLDKQQREAKVELKIVRAQLEKALFDVNVNYSQVEKLLRDAMEWRIKIEMAEIRKRVEMRKIVGEDVWQQLIKIQEQRKMRRLNNKKGNQPKQPGPKPNDGPDDGVW